MKKDTTELHTMDKKEKALQDLAGALKKQRHGAMSQGYNNACKAKVKQG